MKFKTLKTSETGKRLAALIEKKEDVEAQAQALAKEYDATRWNIGAGAVWGGISALILTDEPDTKLWRRKHAGWYPKKNSKAGKALAKRFEALPVVDKEDLNSCVGFGDRFFKTIGLNWMHEEYFGFAVGEDWEYEPPADCTEITVSEYNKIFRE